MSLTYVKCPTFCYRIRFKSEYSEMIDKAYIEKCRAFHEFQLYEYLTIND